MRLNTTKSIKLGRQVKKRFGTWEAVRAVSRRENGIFVVPADPKPAEGQDQTRQRPATA